MKEIAVKTNSREEMIDITPEIRTFVTESGIQDGVVTIFNPHTTGAVTINEGADPDVKTDILNILRKQFPESPQYLHSEGNSDAHIKSSLIGSDRTIIIENGELKLGTWQKLFFCEFDGPRRRKIWVKIIPG